MKITSADIETDALDAKKIWCWSMSEHDEKMNVKNLWTETDYDRMRSLAADPDRVWVFHNGARFDVPTIERLLEVKIEGTLVDTLALSWYLYPLKLRHGLEYWGEEFGVPKPEIDDWENLTLKEYIHRCEEDVKIQRLLWKQIFKNLMQLYGNKERDVWRCVEHLTFKLKCAALQEKAGWALDVDQCKKLDKQFNDEFEESKSKLEEGMPKVPVMAKKKRPKKPFKKSGELSAIGVKWDSFCKEHGIDFDSFEEHPYQSGWKDPNAGSHKQLKDWLFSLGWNPKTFDFKKDPDTGSVRKIPQISNSDVGELCGSVDELMKSTPTLENLRNMGIVKHRATITNTFIKNCVDGRIQALVQGFTNTLRFKHKVFLNIPSLRKKYGKEIRSLLIASSDEYELCGSDMCSLEDRTKQHFMWPYDPEYVKDMMEDDFDPHCDIAKEANIMSEEDVRLYKAEDTPDDIKKELSLKRHSGKSTNYAATYGAAADTIARSAGVPVSVGETLHNAYWTRNWSLKAIADACIVKEVTFQGKKLKWLWNPVAQLWIYLKKDKDRFSTLNQSTGTYCFDRWLMYILENRKQLTGQAHDEGIWELKKGNREAMEKILKDAIHKVNEELKLNRVLDCDVSFGDSYADIH